MFMKILCLCWGSALFEGMCRFVRSRQLMHWSWFIVYAGVVQPAQFSYCLFWVVVMCFMSHLYPFYKRTHRACGPSSWGPWPAVLFCKHPMSGSHWYIGCRSVNPVGLLCCLHVIGVSGMMFTLVVLCGNISTCRFEPHLLCLCHSVCGMFH